VQVLGAGNEVHEGVALVQVLALLLVPRAAHLRAAPDVRDRVHHAAVQQRQPLGREVRVDADAIRPITIEVHGGGRLRRTRFRVDEILMEYERHGNLGALRIKGEKRKQKRGRGVVVSTLVISKVLIHKINRFLNDC
jgi:hypothetical protein